MANIITLSRILVGIALAFLKPFSPVFYILYCCGGVSDMIDGTVARRTGSASEFGSKLDTVADMFFFIVCLIKLAPRLNCPVWVWIWICVIAAIKIASICAGYLRRKKLATNHTILNKVTGLLLFVYPLTVTKINSVYSILVLCAIATIAAVQECCMMTKDRS